MSVAEPFVARDSRPAYFRSLAEAIRDPDELITSLDLPDTLREPARRAAVSFPLIVPRSFLARMRPADPDDPLLRQVLPIGAENDSVEGFIADAVGDLHARTAPGLIHKYHGRALLIAAGSCAVNCRYCFRRHYPYQDDPRRPDDWEPALAAIEADRSLTEIILSGGDPLMLTDSRLASLVAHLEGISHVRRLRIHTRLPIVLPDRVTAELLDLFASTRLATAVVVHANHPREVVGDCAVALKALAASPASLLNQAVLLRGVNDDADILAELSERLFMLGVLPYYLHQLDRVAGAAHFEVPEATGLAVVAELARRLPGYLVPRYVRETAGEPGKTSIH
ncbi:MAG: EF-P beta-lysylation protein EpmB [Planctomycetota bacterium]|nr:EF-P beta-lysylation protein EpmB [Planctomycetota bacterium]